MKVSCFVPVGNNNNHDIKLGVVGCVGRNLLFSAECSNGRVTPSYQNIISHLEAKSFLERVLQ
jgi:hypothetical protein